MTRAQLAPKSLHIILENNPLSPVSRGSSTKQITRLILDSVLKHRSEIAQLFNLFFGG
jgi:hypothetical protein